jgi:hypothetical protein
MYEEKEPVVDADLTKGNVSSPSVATADSLSSILGMVPIFKLFGMADVTL